MSLDRTEKFWDKLAKHFDSMTKHFESPPIELSKQYLKENDIVLDFGCATGTVANEIANCVKQVVGIDISSKMIDIAKKKADTLNVENIDFKQATIFDGCYDGKQFDVVLAFNILHFFKSIKDILLRIYELLKPNGIIIVSTVCLGEWSFSTVLQRIFFTPLILNGIIPYMKFFKVSELNDILQESSFKVVTQLNSSTNYFIVVRKI